MLLLWWSGMEDCLMSAAEKIERAKQDRIARERVQRKKRKKMDKLTLIVLTFALCATGGGLYFGGKILNEYISERKAEAALTAMRDQADGGLAEMPENASDLIRRLLAQTEDG